MKMMMMMMITRMRSDNLKKTPTGANFEMVEASIDYTYQIPEDNNNFQFVFLNVKILVMLLKLT